MRITTDEPARAGFTLSSPGLADNATLTKPYVGKSAANPNCVGDSLSPALEWTLAATTLVLRFAH